jgi:serine/threonine protein kinase
MSQDYVAGQRLGDYEVLEVLGAGGMGKVYKVRNVISDRVEAMKIILPNLANQKELADRFLREIKLLGSLNHPNIAGLRTALTINDQLVMIMEYVEGITLASRLQQGPIPPTDAINYTDQILSALSYAHRLNVIHRDIKPANMMLTPQGVVKLMDFGLARPGEQSTAMTVTSTTLGSVNYMPPEQVKGEAVDARSDLYSLGVSLYEMVTGRLPFQAESGYSLMTAHVQETPKAPIAIRPDLPTTLNQIILIALAKDPAKRFQSSEAFRNALKSVPLTASVAAGAETSAAAWAPVAPVATSQPEIQPAVAAAVSSSAVASAATNSYRGFYVALGALLVVAVLFAAGFYLPRRIRTHASTGSATPAPTASAMSQPVAEPPPSTAVAPASETPVAPSVNNKPEVAPTAPASSSTPTTANDAKGALPVATLASPDLKPATTPTQSKQAVHNASERPSPRPATVSASVPPPSASNGQPQPTSQSNTPEVTTAAAAAAELEQVQQESNQLNSRALAVSQSLDGLRRAQSAQGLGLRGDMVAAEQRMQTNMSAAQSALDKQDAAKAKKYLDMAAFDVEKLEKFLGR